MSHSSARSAQSIIRLSCVTQLNKLWTAQNYLQSLDVFRCIRISCMAKVDTLDDRVMDWWIWFVSHLSHSWLDIVFDLLHCGLKLKSFFRSVSWHSLLQKEGMFTFNKCIVHHNPEILPFRYVIRRRDFVIMLLRWCVGALYALHPFDEVFPFAPTASKVYFLTTLSRTHPPGFRYVTLLWQRRRPSTVKSRTQISYGSFSCARWERRTFTSPKLGVPRMVLDAMQYASFVCHMFSEIAVSNWIPIRRKWRWRKWNICRWSRMMSISYEVTPSLHSWKMCLQSWAIEGHCSKKCLRSISSYIVQRVGDGRVIQNKSITFTKMSLFLAVQTSSIGDLVTVSLTDWLTDSVRTLLNLSARLSQWID